MVSRPELNSQISVGDFLDYYWLKEELLVFCRQNGLPTSGAKKELTQRIATFLRTGQIVKPQPGKRRKPRAKMPDTFTRSTVIGPGWRCSQSLRAFFLAEIGPNFHFNKVMRDIIQQGAGQTLQDAIDAWYESQTNPPKETAIAPQFEYNRHIREYFQQHPGSTLDEAIKAWREKRARRK